MQIKHVWRGQVRPLLFQFLNIAIAGQNSVAPRQNVIKNGIQLVILLRESIPTVTKLILGLRTLSGNFFREILVGRKRTFTQFSSGGQTNNLPGTNFLHINRA